MRKRCTVAAYLLVHRVDKYVTSLRCKRKHSYDENKRGIEYTQQGEQLALHYSRYFKSRQDVSVCDVKLCSNVANNKKKNALSDIANKVPGGA